MKRESGFFGKRPGIIYLAETVCLSEYATSDVAGGIWAGIHSLPQEQDVDLLACAGDIHWNGRPSIAHRLIHPDSADGFLVRRPRKGEDCVAFFAAFAERPLVYLSSSHGPRPLEIIDAEPQMRELVRHLVQQHQCRKIAFVPGPSQHIYSQQRLAGYLAGLEEMGLEADPRLLLPAGGWFEDAGRLAAGVLLDERGLAPGKDFDAVMCVTDQVAMGVFEAFQQRHIPIPGAVRLTGFNNTREGRCHSPSLTTVAMPYALQGHRGMRRLLNQMGLGPNVPDQAESSPYLVIGESCGCGDPHLSLQCTDDAPLRLVELPSPDLEALKARLYGYLCERLYFQEARRVSDEIWRSLLEAVHTGDPDYLLGCVKQQIRVGYTGLVDQLFWQKLWSDFRQILPRVVDQPSALAHADKTMEIVRNGTAAVHIREQGKQALWEMHVAKELRTLSLELSLAADMSGIQAMLLHGLKDIDIHSSWLVLYDEPVVYADPPEQARLVLAMENGQQCELPSDGVLFQTKQLLPLGYRKGKKAGAFISFPVMQREYEYGYLIVNHSQSTNWGEMLSDLVGSAVRSLRLREVLARKKQQLEYSYRDLLNAQKRLVEADKMAALGELVAGMAHEINTPIGIGVTAVSTLLDETHLLNEMIEHRQAKLLPDSIHHLQECAEVALRNLERAAQLIESFKLIAVDQTRSEVRKINLADYLQDVVRSLIPKLRPGEHKIEIDCTPDIEITCDPSIIARIVTNLVMNSLLHGFDQKRNGQIGMHCWKSATEWGIEYRDDGCGMDAATLEKMFHPFFTTKRGRGGTGLGMHIVYNLVTQGLKGTIQCESSPGNGAVFTLRLPA